MRLLVLGPQHEQGSLTPYIAVLVEQLRRVGCDVTWTGTTGLPYDQEAGAFWPPERILAAARTVLDDVDLAAFDLVALHFGNLETEQVLPLLLPGRPRPPLVYHVHSLAWTLFRDHVPHPLADAVQSATHRLDGYVCFGSYAWHHLGQTAAATRPHRVVPLPTTIPDGTRPARLELPPAVGPVRGSLYGFGTPWKDIAGLTAVLERVSVPLDFVLAGPLWHARPGRAGRSRVHLVPGYLDPAQRLGLVHASDLGIFPYRPHPSFQGSGAIADYLRHGVPVLATAVANFGELIGEAGVVVPPDDPDALADALERLCSDPDALQRLRVHAAAASERFSVERHAGDCLSFYERIAATQPSTLTSVPRPSAAHRSGPEVLP